MKTNWIALAFAAETISRGVKLCTLFLAATIIAKIAFRSSLHRLQTMNRKCLRDAARELYLGQ
jgi:hypothetical protein